MLQWLTTLPSGSFLNSNQAWQRLPYNTARGFGAAFDAMGGPLADTNAANARFCTHVRMSWLYPTTMSVAGNAVLRAEIRVFWLRDGQAPLDSTASMCSATQSAAQARAIGLTTDRYHFVYQTVGLRQHLDAGPEAGVRRLGEAPRVFPYRRRAHPRSERE